MPIWGQVVITGAVVVLVLVALRLLVLRPWAKLAVATTNDVVPMLQTLVASFRGLAERLEKTAESNFQSGEMLKLSAEVTQALAGLDRSQMQKLITLSESLHGKIAEAAITAIGVAQDLADAHKRADDTKGPHGAAADAAAQQTTREKELNNNPGEAMTGGQTRVSFLGFILWQQTLQNGIVYSLAILSAVLGGGAAAYRAIKKVRENSQKAKQSDELEIQKRIADAVETAKADVRHQVELAKQLAKHWEDMTSVFEKERNHEREVRAEEYRRLEVEVVRLREERDKLNSKLIDALNKVEEVVDLNLNLQGSVTVNRRRIEELERKVAELGSEGAE